jgi:hypothetical protein
VEVHQALAKMGLKLCEAQPPGLIDGGDVLYVSDLLFAGKSRFSSLIVFLPLWFFAVLIASFPPTNSFFFLC